MALRVTSRCSAVGTSNGMRAADWAACGIDVIIDKIEQITGGVYPRLLPVMRSIMALERGRMDSGWEAVLAEICGA